MQFPATRKYARNIHILIAIYQFIYIYTPLHNLPYGLSIVQWVTFPLLVLSGFWLIKGHKIWLWAEKRFSAGGLSAQG